MYWVHGVAVSGIELSESATRIVECCFGEFEVDGTDGAEFEVTGWPGEVSGCA